MQANGACAGKLQYVLVRCILLTACRLRRPATVSTILVRDILVWCLFEQTLWQRLASLSASWPVLALSTKADKVQLCKCLIAAKMGEFSSEADLNQFLCGISPNYGKHAAPLWNGEIRSYAELASASVTTLAGNGIPVADIETMPTHVKRAGMCSATSAELLFILNSPRIL